MAHAVERNAGQRYASARKHGRKDAWKLKAAACNRRESGVVVDLVAINAKIASENRIHAAYAGSRRW